MSDSSTTTPYCQTFEMWFNGKDGIQTLSGWLNYLETLKAEFPTLPEKVNIGICPPFHLLHSLKPHFDDSPFTMGGQGFAVGQNPKKGITKGDGSVGVGPNFEGISDPALDLKQCIYGHSHQRHTQRLTDTEIRAQMYLMSKAKKPGIYCFGQTKWEEEAGPEWVRRAFCSQLEPLRGMPLEWILKKIFALEPVYAIGTGVTPTDEQIVAAQMMAKQILEEIFPGHGWQMPLQYGGSLDIENIERIFALRGPSGEFIIDGGLIATGAMLAANFIEMIKYAIAEAAKRGA